MRKHLTYANTLSTLALFIALSGTGYAVSQLPSHSVGSKQLRKSAVTTKKIRNSAVTNSKIARDAVTGSKVIEATLDTVPSATTASNVNGIGEASFTVGRGNTGTNCDPTDQSFITCVSTTVPFPRSGRTLVFADTEWDGNESSAPFDGNCKLQVDGVDFGEQIWPGNGIGLGVGWGSAYASSTGMNGVTGVLGAGDHVFALLCSERSGSMIFRASSISAVMIGSS